MECVRTVHEPEYLRGTGSNTTAVVCGTEPGVHNTRGAFRRP
jgi:hypothetical protein